MAILNRSGQLVANSSQRTLVFDTEDQRVQFLATLPEGVAVEECFDIYIKESSTVYAAGVPFRLREVVVKEAIDLWFSPTGNGEGRREDDPANGSRIGEMLNTYAEIYDFGGFPLTVHLDYGKYNGFDVNNAFVNCPEVDILGRGTKMNADGSINYDETTMFQAEANTDAADYIAKPTLSFTNSMTVAIDSCLIENEAGAVYAANGATVILTMDGFLQNNVPSGENYRHPTRGYITSDGGGSMVQVFSIWGCMNTADCVAMNQAALADASAQADDAFFLAINGGQITCHPASLFLSFEDVDQVAHQCYFMGNEAVFRAVNNGIIDLANVDGPLGVNIDIGCVRAQNRLPGAGWAKVTASGIFYYNEALTAVGDIVCDTTGIVEKIEEGGEV